MDRKTRHQLKQDEFRDSLVRLEEFAKKNYKEIITYSVIAVAVVGLAVGLKYYTDRQEESANAELGEALATFRASVGQPAPGQAAPGGATYATAQEKYKKALQQFNAIVENHHIPPRPKAVEIALYQAGVSQSLLGDQKGAIQTLTAASESHDSEIASMAKYALAGELAKAGNISQAVKLYQELADRPTITVPKASALLAMADVYRGSQPAQARQIYQRVQKEFADNPVVAEAVRQNMTSLAP